MHKVAVSTIYARMEEISAALTPARSDNKSGPVIDEYETESKVRNCCIHLRDESHREPNRSTQRTSG